MSRCTWFRKHIFGEVKSDGFQYCTRCGVAVLPPCNHDWILIDNLKKKYDWSYRLIHGYREDQTIKIYECSKCKELIVSKFLI